MNFSVKSPKTLKKKMVKRWKKPLDFLDKKAIIRGKTKKCHFCANPISVAMLYEPLHHTREKETIKLPFGCSCKVKSARSSNIFCLLFDHACWICDDSSFK